MLPRKSLVDGYSRREAAIVQEQGIGGGRTVFGAEINKWLRSLRKGAHGLLEGIEG